MSSVSAVLPTKSNQNQLPSANAWNLIPPLGNIDAYISAVNRLPMLTLEEEINFATRLKEQNDIESD